MVKNQFSKNCVIYTSEGEILQLEYAKKGALKGKMILSFSSANHLVIFIVNHKFKTSKTFLNKIDILSQNFSVVRSGNIGDSIYLSGFVKKRSLEYYNLNVRNNYFENIVELISHYGSTLHYKVIKKCKKELENIY